MITSGALVVLRGNSGSGKSTVARMLQRSFERGSCLVVPQDGVRRDMLRERDTAGGLNLDLIEAIATWGLERGLVVVVEGIFNASRYEPMLQRLADRAAQASFFAWDLELDETLRRHRQRAKGADFTADDMAAWYHGWQPLSFVAETRFDESVSAEDAVALIGDRLGGL